MSENYNESIERDFFLGASIPEKGFNGDQIYGIMPSSKWGWPWDNGYDATYVVRVTFMGKSLSWHKWAVVPLMNVQKQLIEEGWDDNYHWEDLQTWNKRMIAGTNIPSNHAWPTAIDINPKNNPMRYDNVLVTDIPYRIVEIFKRYGFKWGGEYKSVKDAMHFEYLGEPVKENMSIPYPNKKNVILTAPPYMRDGKDGITGIKLAQKQLIKKGFSVGPDGADGVYGYNTMLAVRKFQIKNPPLQVDDVLGPKTWNVLFS